jgi:hypothetical protein
MKKLEDITKKDFFTVPEGYFQKLSSTIQRRTVEAETHPEKTTIQIWKPALTVVILAFVAIGVYWIARPVHREGAEEILASVETEQLMMYLSESDMTGDFFFEPEAESFDVEALESEVYDFDVDETIIEDIAIENKLDSIQL